MLAPLKLIGLELTTPPATEKFEPVNAATPLTVVVALLPLIVTV